MTADFSKILGKRKEDIEDPVPLPQGHYAATIKSTPNMGESKQKGTPFAEFTFMLGEPQADVALDQLPKTGTRKKDGTPREIKHQFWLTDDTEYQLRDFLNTLPIEWSTLGEAFENVTGRDVILELTHEYEDLTKATPARMAEIEAGAKPKLYVKVRNVRGA